MHSAGNTEDYLNFLLGPEGQKMLNMEIAKARMEVGDQKFERYARQFFQQLSEQQQKHGIQIKVPIKPSILMQQRQIAQPEYQEEEEVIETEPTDDFEPHFEVKKQLIEQGANKFRITYNNGDYYEGQMEENQKNGWGIYHYSNGQKYDGLFVDDMISGYGKYYFLSGAIYEGDWYKGQKHGFGTLKFSNKDEYIGQFKDDQLNGKGTYNYANGDSFKGTWMNGKKHGRGQLTSLDGRVMIGQWVEDNFSI